MAADGNIKDLHVKGWSWVRVQGWEVDMRSLNSLSDEEILEYYNLYNNLTPRERNIKIKSYDTKFALHIFRLLDEIEQILTVGDVDLLRNKEQLKQVANGYYTLKEIDIYFKETEKRLELAYNKSTLPYSPRTKEVRNLLSGCLNEFYG